MNCVLPFQSAAALGAELSGGKGWNMGRLARFGFRVPPGCVVTVQAYWDFFAINDLGAQVEALGRLTADDAATEAGGVRLAALQDGILQGRLPDGLLQAINQHLVEAGVAPDDPLAVRSSATAEDSARASFAGIHRSRLNITGDNALAESIKSCYASLWSQAAVSYRRKMELSDRDVGAALVIQKLMASLYSGVAFSADPVTGRRDRVVINASFGLGESIVSGAVEADEYHLHIDHTGPVKLVGGRIGYKTQAVRPDIDGGTLVEELGYADRSEPVLSKPHLEELTRIVRRIQDTLGEGTQPQDVEWCHDGWHFTVTQARPITALPEATFPALAGQATIWSNANLKDAAPGVQSTLGWWFNSLTVEVLLRQIFWRAVYDFPEGLNWSRLFDGRIYMNLSALQWAAFDAFGWSPVQTNRALGGHQPEIKIPSPAPFWTTLGRQRFTRLARMGSVLRRSAARADRMFKQVWDWSAEFESHPFAERYHELDFLKRLWSVEKQRREFLPETMVHNVGALWSTRLAEFLDKRIPGRGEALTSALLAGSDRVTSAEQGYRIIAMAQQATREEQAKAYFENEPFDPSTWRTALQGTLTARDLAQFLQEFGHRGVYEMEIMNPRWSEDPSFILNTLRGFIREGIPPEDPRAAARQKRDRAQAQVQAALGLRPSYPVYRFLLGRARKAMELREGAKSALVRLIRPARIAALAIGARLVSKGHLDQPDQVFFLTGDEIASLVTSQWDGQGLPAILAHRQRERRRLESQPTADVIMGDRAVVNWRTIAESGLQRAAPGERAALGSMTEDGSLQGVAVSSGQASGPARLIRHPHEGQALLRGEVLVAPSTDPAWTPLFLRAAAVVMEVGGYLSHGAIVAREYGIPAVVNVAGAMVRFQDGEILRVDGDTGVVTKQESR